MAIDLKKLKPTTVSRDLKGKFVFLYGPAKIGKTTLAVQFPRNLLLAVEHGYNVIDNIYAVDVPTWAEFKKYVKQLQDDELKSMFDTITIDTITLLYERCEAYICDREGVDKLADIPFGAGFNMLDSEFETWVRKITQIMDNEGKIAYGLCLIGHEKSRTESDGQISVTHIMPDMSNRCAKIINRMVDITAYIGMEEDGNRYIYPRQFVKEDKTQRTEIFAGSHFYGLNDKIELSYDGLVNAIADAMTVDGTGKEITLSEAPVQVMQKEELNFNEIRDSIKKIVKKLKDLDENGDSNHMGAYKRIVDEQLGKGKLVKDCTESQVDQLSLILDDLEEYVESNNL